MLASDACERGSFLHTLASNITAVVVGARNWIVPAAELEPEFFPQKEWILDAIHEKVLPLSNHTVTTVQTDDDLLRRYREGV